ncbi:translation initiation factor IF-2 [Falsiporphyromonas endometrii]|uniref:translation initiation factor IF-2 n=1 Tax=Falsiporphyromonas endometrii TaxID=1387297 RepID=UPI0036D2D974
MSTVKLFSLAKEFNVGVNTLTDKLKESGFEVDANPNSKINKKQFECLADAFKKEVSTDIIDKLRKKFEPKSQSSEINATAKETKAAPAEKSSTVASKDPKVIKTKVPESLQPKVVVKGNIEDLPKPKAKEEVVPVKVEIKKEEVKKTVSDSTPKEHSTKPLSHKDSVETSKVVSNNKQNTPSEKESSSKIKDEDNKKEMSQKAKTTPGETEKAIKSNSPVADKKNKKEPIETKSPTDVKRTKEAKPSGTEAQNKGKKNDNKNSMSEAKKPQSKTKKTEKKDEIFRPGATIPEPAVKIVGKIDLDSINSSMRPKKKSKEERRNEGRKRRKRINKQQVDVKSEAAKVTSENERRRSDNNKSRRDKRRNKRQQQNAHQEVSDEDVQKQIKETLARLTSKTNTFTRAAKYRRDRRDAERKAQDEAMEQEQQESKIIKLTEFVTVSDLATMMDVPVNEVIATCMSIGLFVSINQRLDGETLNMVAEEFGYKTEFVSADVVETINAEEEEKDDPKDLIARPPIVTVMGHVDHGKTSLLDNIRATNVIAGEAGGITQHIGAYNLKLANGRHITFLDTPGHEAFTAMRARGAKVTDIAIIIIAADDDVMPQTVEAINHASAAGVPIVFAINKCDKPTANPDKIKEQLSAMNYLVEDWGGKYQCQEISAKKGIGVPELLEKVLLEADMLNLQANPKRKASGTIIESSLDKGRGYVATILVENGTLKIGDIVLAGKHHGRIKAMFNERNQRVKKAGPSEPVLILGLSGAPTAGDNFNVLDSEQEAKDIANKREQLQREQNDRTRKVLTLDEVARRKELGDFHELNIIIKGDVDGSVEALADSLIGLSTEEIQVNVIHKAVGQISESDIVLAAASEAIVIGFQVRPSQAARKLAEQDGVEVRTYSIIYDTIEDIKSAMEGMLSPEIKEEITANLEVLQTFKITKVGTIAGCMVQEGKIKRTNKVRLIRDGIVIYTGELGSLKRFKDDAKEVVAGLECGLNIVNFNDIKEGDMIEAFTEIEIKKTL